MTGRFVVDSVEPGPYRLITRTRTNDLVYLAFFKPYVRDKVNMIAMQSTLHYMRTFEPDMVCRIVNGQSLKVYCVAEYNI